MDFAIFIPKADLANAATLSCSTLSARTYDRMLVSFLPYDLFPGRPSGDPVTAPQHSQRACSVMCLVSNVLILTSTMSRVLCPFILAWLPHAHRGRTELLGAPPPPGSDALPFSGGTPSRCARVAHAVAGFPFLLVPPAFLALSRLLPPLLTTPQRVGRRRGVGGSRSILARAGVTRWTS